MMKIPIPPTETMASLVAGCKAALSAGTRSVACPHSPSVSEKFLPMWVIPYWAEVVELRTGARKAWAQAEHFLRQRRKIWTETISNESPDAIMQEAYDILSYLPWCGDIHGFDEIEPLHRLATYASRTWLGTSHEDQMLDLLRRDLLFKGSKVTIANMTFFKIICDAYACRDTVEYQDSRKFSNTRKLGEELEKGMRDVLGTMVHVEGDHWVAVALDFAKSLFWYGDSFGKRPVEEVVSVINWWTQHHAGRTFEYRRMKITSQTDGFSCGLLGTNALNHFYLPDDYPLINAVNVDVERVCVMIRVVRQHLDQAEV